MKNVGSKFEALGAYSKDEKRIINQIVLLYKIIESIKLQPRDTHDSKNTIDKYWYDGYNNIQIHTFKYNKSLFLQSKTIEYFFEYISLN